MHKKVVLGAVIIMQQSLVAPGTLRNLLGRGLLKPPFEKKLLSGFEYGLLGICFFVFHYPNKLTD